MAACDMRVLMLICPLRTPPRSLGEALGFRIGFPSPTVPIAPRVTVTDTNAVAHRRAS